MKYSILAFKFLLAAASVHVVAAAPMPVPGTDTGPMGSYLALHPVPCKDARGRVRIKWDDEITGLFPSDVAESTEPGTRFRANCERPVQLDKAVSVSTSQSSEAIGKPTVSRFPNQSVFIANGNFPAVHGTQFRRTAEAPSAGQLQPADRGSVILIAQEILDKSDPNGF
ncbi:hypothetical protein B0H13DRAFT_1891834 [Mycena leptocephala]|nr:hypothetical protein B0H13DRAFT_1891834 [Mycena leptocephala]